MKIERKIKKLIDPDNIISSARTFINALLSYIPLSKLFLAFANQCVLKAIAEKGKKQRLWYHIARTFHRAYSELNMEEGKRLKFKISRRDVCECQKCKKRFRIDFGKEQNCKYELIESVVQIICPNCGQKE